MKKSTTTNTFQEGMIMDFNPLVVPEGSLTKCLNGTIITMNGNEYCLQNDMGNGRVETAYLPEGYIPLGTTELGGIIYIVSYNPLIDKCQIGSFPSPERNITTDELGESNKILKINQFYGSDDFIITPIVRIDLTDKELNPGDKFLIACNSLTDDISARNNIDFNPDKNPRYLKFNVVSINENGKATNLNNTLVWNEGYYLKNGTLSKTEGSPDLDEYRDFIKSNYCVFSETSGQLAILAELECINTFSVFWDVVENGDNWNFYFFYNWTYDNLIDYNKINLYKVRIDVNKSKVIDHILTEYPKLKGTDNDIMKNPDNEFYNPTYIKDLTVDLNTIEHNSKILRKNDGTDNYYLLNYPLVIPKGDEIINIDVYPGMPFGYLEYLKQSFSINLKSINSGEIDLKEYRYYYNPNKTITLNWGLEAYPAPNTSINDVVFTFYRISKNNLSKITNIDNDAKKKISGLDLKYTEYTTVKKTSYSGNFTETIELEENTVYITEICIKYTELEDKYVYFYRILYNSELFNQYYFEKSDFKEIILKDVLNSIEFTIDSKQSERDSDPYVTINGEKGEIVGFLNNSDERDSINYLINHDYDINLKAQLIPKINDIFKLEITKMDNLNIEEGEFNCPTETKQMFFNNDLVPIDTDLPKIIKVDKTSDSPTSENGIVNISNKFTIQTPFRVDYKYITSSPIPYKLEHFNILPLWLLVDGKSRHIYLYTTDTYLSHNDVPEDQWDHYGDDEKGRKIQTLKQYGNTYQILKDYLKNYDILALRFRTYHEAKAPDEGQVTMWGYGNPIGHTRRYFDQSIEWNYSSEPSSPNTGPNFIIYAVLDKKEEIQLFTFGLPSKNNKWYGTSLKADGKITKWNLNYPITIQHSLVTNDLLRKPFDRYYKIVDNIGTATIKSWSIIYYYNNYIWTIPIIIKSKLIYKLKINDSVEIEPNFNVKNLQYIDSQDIDLTINISNQENFNSFINQVLSPTVENRTRVMFEDKMLYIDNVSPSLVYDNEGKPVLSLFKDDGTGTSTLTSENALKIIDSQLKLELGNLNDLKYIQVMGRSEEQNLTIKNVLFI